MLTLRSCHSPNMEDDASLDDWMRQQFALSQEDFDEVLLKGTEFAPCSAPEDVASLLDRMLGTDAAATLSNLDAPPCAAVATPVDCCMNVGSCSRDPEAVDVEQEGSVPTQEENVEAAAGAKAKRTRKPSQAQRDAHKRFRERRKQQMQDMELEVAAKQQLVRQLEQQKQELHERLRALELMIGGGDRHIAEISGLLHQLQLQPTSWGNVPAPELSSCSSAGGSLPSPTADDDPLASQQPGLPRINTCYSGASGLLTGSSSPSTDSARLSTPSTGSHADVPQLLLGPGHLQLTGQQQQQPPQQQQCLGQQQQQVGPQLQRLPGAADLLEASLFCPPSGLVCAVAGCTAKAAAGGDRDVHWQPAIQTMMQIYKAFLSQVAPLALQAQLTSPLDPSLCAQIQQLRHGVYRSLSAQAVQHRLPAYLLHTLNMETGMLQQQAPAGHWEGVARNLAPRLPPERLRDMLNCKATYATCMCRIKQHRQVLLQQLQEVLVHGEACCTRATDKHLSDLQGPYVEAHRLLASIDSNLRREFALEGCLQRVLSNLLDPLQMAEICMHSYPFLPDFHGLLGYLEQQQQQEAAGMGNAAAAARARPLRATRRSASVAVH